jgi:hypothetical protein
MSARTHLVLRLTAIAVIAVASMVPRGGAMQSRVQLASLSARATASSALARR